jgi:hypothetical protein
VIKFDRYKVFLRFAEEECEVDKDYCSQELLDFFRDVVEYGEKSQYFNWEVPKLVDRTSKSQTRSQTRHSRYPKLLASIIAQGVTTPLLTCRPVAHMNTNLVDGTNRLDCVLEAFEKEKFGEGIPDLSYKVPVVVVPPSLVSELNGVLDDVQVVLNEHEPSEGNEKETIINKIIRRARAKKLDLGDDDTRKFEGSYWKRRLKNHSVHQVWGMITTANNRRKSQNSKILVHSNDDTLRKFLKAFGVFKQSEVVNGIANIPSIKIEGKVYKDVACSAMFIEGSNYDQSVYRTVKRDILGKTNVQLTNIKKHNGCYTRYFSSIVSVFGEHKKCYDTFFKKFLASGVEETKARELAESFLPELVIVQPQLTSPLTTQELSISGLPSLVTTFPECPENSKYYIVVTRRQMSKLFGSKSKDLSFDKTWIGNFDSKTESSDRGQLKLSVVS